MSDIPDPEWLKQHKALYGEPAEGFKALPKSKPPTSDETIIALTIETLLADVTKYEFHYARRMVLPKWSPGKGRL